MAKTTGPLFSVDASGKLADSIVYSRWRGVKYVRQFVIPANPNSGAQQVQRGRMTEAVQNWVQALEAEVQQAWRDYQAGQAKSGVNEYVSRAIGAQKAGRSLTSIYDLTVTPGDGQIVVNWKTGDGLKGRILVGTKHRVYIATHSESTAVSSHTLTATDLTNEVPYCIFITQVDEGSFYAEAGEVSAIPVE